MSARTRKDWILWGALGCALVSTAHAEYVLATATGVHPWVALAVPGALDLYVIRALLSRREVPFAVAVMVAANVVSHLITAGVLEASTAVIASVGALAPVLLWRIYALKHAGTPHSPVLEDPGAVSAPVLAPSAPPSTPAWAPGYHLDGCDGLHSLEAPWECAQRADVLAASAAAPDHVPASWMEEEYPETYPSAPPLPALPPEYVSSAPELSWADAQKLPSAREYVAECTALETDTSVRGLMKHASIGQARAGRLLDFLEAEALAPETEGQ